MKTNKPGIYKITNLVNGKFYIGQSKNCPQRFRDHKSALKRSNFKHKNPHLQNSWDKYGEDNFQFEIIEECIVEYLDEREQWYLDNLKPEYNVCKIASSNIGRIVSKETREKISKAKKGKTGYKHTEEAKQKISLAAMGNKRNLGKKVSEETKAKISKANSGRVFTPEVKEKMHKFPKNYVPWNKDTKGKGIMIRTKETTAKAKETWLKNYVPTLNDVCGHLDRKHYGKGMCRNCWRKLFEKRKPNRSKENNNE